MAAVSSFLPWDQSPQVPNPGGIRRLKIANADALALIAGVGLVPQRSFQMHEFIFPSGMQCAASVQKSASESGADFWLVQIGFAIPHMSDMLISWSASETNAHWIAIAEGHNGITRAFGGSLEGLKMDVQGATGGQVTDPNSISFTFSGQQLIPYTLLPSYEDHVLFPNESGFSYGFSTGFNS